MRIYELSHIGEFHVNHNEDFMVSEEAGKSRRLIAVMDGCSSGTDSHFASTLIGKLLKKISKQESYREYVKKEIIELKIQLRNIATQLFEELSNLNRQLDLKADEILSTLILAILDIDKYQAEILIVRETFISTDENISVSNF